MMPGIIVGVDGSVHSQWALDWAVSEAASRHAPLTAVSVHHQRAAYTEGDPSLDQVVEELEALVDKAVRRRPGPPPVTVAVALGSPAAELLRAARDAELLVVGSRGNGGLGRLGGLGSVSDRLAYEARCQVVIIFRPSGDHLTVRRAAANKTDHAGTGLLQPPPMPRSHDLQQRMRCRAEPVRSPGPAAAARSQRKVGRNGRAEDRASEYR